MVPALINCLPPSAHKGCQLYSTLCLPLLTRVARFTQLSASLCSQGLPDLLNSLLKRVARFTHLYQSLCSQGLPALLTSAHSAHNGCQLYAPLTTSAHKGYNLHSTLCPLLTGVANITLFSTFLCSQKLPTLLNSFPPSAHKGCQLYSTLCLPLLTRVTIFTHHFTLVLTRVASFLCLSLFARIVSFTYLCISAHKGCHIYIPLYIPLLTRVVRLLTSMHPSTHKGCQLYSLLWLLLLTMVASFTHLCLLLLTRVIIFTQLSASYSQGLLASPYSLHSFAHKGCQLYSFLCLPLLTRVTIFTQFSTSLCSQGSFTRLTLCHCSTLKWVGSMFSKWILAPWQFHY